MRRLQAFVAQKRFIVLIIVASCVALGIAAFVGATVLAANGGQPSKAGRMQQAAAAATARAQGPHAPKHPGSRVASCPISWIPGIYPYRADEEPKNAPMNNVATLRTAGGQDYMVAAGAAHPGSFQGELYVKQVWVDPCKEPLNAAPPMPKIYFDPHQDGSLTITKITGSTVYFRAADGTIGSFNVVTGSYQ